MRVFGMGVQIDVSIHASAREATFRGRVIITALVVSIHASAREATPDSIAHYQILPSFNPRLRTGGDTENFIFTTKYTCFNPRLRTGGDPPSYR